ncbi:hypothetical protein UlMin_041323 [Ulmus minor]
MGKTPGKWIKNLLLGKKSSKSSLSKGRDALKSSNKGKESVASKLSVPTISVDAPTISSPVVGKVAVSELSSEAGVAGKLQNDEVVFSGVQEDATQAIICPAPPEDPERIRLEQAAVKAQAAFRGYAARRAFRMLKGIIRLQALVRGHLVRRQAVSTLRCVRGVVKLQALARSHKGAKCSNSVGVSASTTQVKRLPKNAFAHKLLASLPTALPLHLQYGSGEPNSTSLWLERWTRSRFWEPISEPKKKPKSKPRRKNESIRTIETEQDRSKRSGRRLSGANAENGSVGSALDSEKRKRNVRKASSHPVNSAQEHPQNEAEKVKRNLRRASDPAKEVLDRSLVESGKPKHRTKKPSGSAPPAAISEQVTCDSAEKKHMAEASPKQSDLEKNMELVMEDDSVDKFNPSLDLQPKKDMAEALPKQSGPETNMELLAEDDPVDKFHHSLDLQPKKDTAEASPKQSGSEKNMELVPEDDPVDKLLPSLDLQPLEIIGKSEDIEEINPELDSKPECISNVTQKTSQRRASLPAKFEPQENGVHNTPATPTTPKLPSYMAPTESAKAKLRAQGSPRFSRDVIEKNAITRRHSLSSSTNSRLTSLSPRAQKLVHATGKGAIRGDRSLSSSRDGGDKLIQIEWKR